MMVTLSDRPAKEVLTDTEIAVFIAAGAASVVYERITPGVCLALAVKMKRGDGEATKLFRFQNNLISMPDDRRDTLLADMVRRVRNYHDTLPLTDDELREQDAQDRR